MDKDKQRQEVSIIGRILSMEALLLLMGVASLIYGITEKATINIFWGIVIIPGVFLLIKVRKKDWKKHWEDLEAQQKAEQNRKNESGDDSIEK
ncbi:hypothetical protein [Pelotalea chapellei]|uniref:Uncharacterized protein n=1 Tax=Pelotalea chapellei TaxID=44671 RepID=A0ABS5U8X0_9BACT|nr:hypothetical protein [Pelotalea chapellei]MBT1072117.1 hypothetical protein [Pelotalea chapellei]